MKKNWKTRFYALKDLIYKHDKNSRKFFSFVFAVILAFALTLSIIPKCSTDVGNQCKQVLETYIADPTIPIDTNLYILEISKYGYEVSSRNTTASCVAKLNNTTDVYEYHVDNGATDSAWLFVMIFIVFTFLAYWIIYILVFEFGIDIYMIIKEKISDLYYEYNVNKTEHEFAISRTEAETHAISARIKDFYDEAEKRGYDAGFIAGRAAGFKKGQDDAYDEGYAAGYANGYDELSDALEDYMNSEDDE